ncbi:MAG: hypothetical protein WC796_05225 [Candidatus Pacearchaeota archaeon]|jgi:hypothetical protein
MARQKKDEGGLEELAKDYIGSNGFMIAFAILAFSLLSGCGIYNYLSDLGEAAKITAKSNIPPQKEVYRLDGHGKYVKFDSSTPRYIPGK